MGRGPIDSPERRLKMLRPARDGGAEIAVASRHADSGEVRGLGSVRIATSKICTFAADRLSEFFIVRREAIDPDSSRVPRLNATEIPFCTLVPHGAQPHGPGRGRWALTAERGLQQ